jgi:uncharacterized protein YdaT
MLDSWPRMVEIFARTGLQAERAVFDANLLAVGALALDLWRDLVLEGARLTDATTTELRHSAVQLLGELDNEQAARERAEQQRDREHARAERERTERQTVERERDEQQRRADEEHRARLQAEHTIERLERELAQVRERAADASEHAPAGQPPAVNHAPAGQPPAVNVVHRDEDWAVVREDAKRASGVFSTKREAVQRAKEIARREGAEVQIEPTGDGSR